MGTRPGLRQQRLLIILIVFTGLAVVLHLQWPFSHQLPAVRFIQPRSRLVRDDQRTFPALPKVPNTIQVAPKPPNPSTKDTPLMSQRLDEQEWTIDVIRDLYFQEVMRVHLHCARKVHVGRRDDGGWDVCMDKGLEMSKPCFVYSFGVGNIWEFDEQMSSRYNCTVRAFDPTMGKAEHVHSPGRVHFYPIGIGGSPNGTKGKFPTRNLMTFLRHFGEQQKTLDVLKIDVEYSEWESLESILNDGLLGQVKQLLMEFHTKEVTFNISSVSDYRRYLTVMQKLEREGFRKFQTHKNGLGIGPFRNTIRRSGRVNANLLSQSCCHEVYYINTRFRRDVG